VSSRTDDPAEPAVDQGQDTQELREPSGRRDRRLLRWLLLGILLVIGGLYVAGYAVAGERLPSKTTIEGVDVGGLRPARARAVLAEELRPAADEQLRVVVGDRELGLDPEALGLEVDVSGSVAQVPVGRSWDVADMWETMVGGEDYEAVVVRVDGLLEQELTALAERLDDPPVEGAVTFSQTGAEPTYPEDGTALDVPGAVERIAAAYPVEDGEPVVLDQVEVEPEVSTAEVSRAMKEFANPAMSAAVAFRTPGRTVRLQPEEFAPALSMSPRDGRLVPRVDRARLLEALEPALADLGADPRDATVVIRGGRPVVVPGRVGRAADRDAVVESFLDLVTAAGRQRTLRIPTTVVQPRLTTAEARALGVTEEVSEFTTYYPHADYRNVNIGRAASLIDGTLLEPGETFSLNETVGERTAENGFTEGFIISNGVFAEELGGGVSQVATTTFNAAFFAGLEDVEHKPHSFYIDRYPVGREATVAWPTVDLRFRNDTDHGVLIQTLHTLSTPASSGALTVRMWSTKTWDITALTGDRYAFTSPSVRQIAGDECVPNTGYGGFQIDVTRVFRRAGDPEVVRREVMHTVYTPSDTVICLG